MVAVIFCLLEELSYEAVVLLRRRDLKSMRQMDRKTHHITSEMNIRFIGLPELE